MPPTDPRFLAADEKTIIDDILMIALRKEAMETEAERERVAALAADPDAVDDLKASADRFLADPSTIRALAATLHKGGAVDSPPRSMRMTRSTPSE